MIAEPQPRTEAFRQSNSKGLLSALAVIVSMLIGCSILWRGWGNKTAMLLGAAMVTISTAGVNLPPWAGEPWLAVPMMSLLAVGTAGVHLLLPFAMLLYEEHARSLPRWHWQVAYAWLALMACFTVAFASDFIAVTQYLSWIGGSSRSLLVVRGVSFVASTAYLVAGWRRSAGAPRNRLALIVLALLAYALGNMLIGWALVQANNFFAAGWLGYVNALMMGLVAPGLLAYAVLRHKLFDLGFAVNRTLVFGAVGVLLLASFALIEWAIKQAIPKVWYGGSVYISAGIAVGLYLLFNRIHHSVEHAIERLFFHKWQLNEAALKRFVARGGAYGAAARRWPGISPPSWPASPAAPRWRCICGPRLAAMSAGRRPSTLMTSPSPRCVPSMARWFLPRSVRRSKLRWPCRCSTRRRWRGWCCSDPNPPARTIAPMRSRSWPGRRTRSGSTCKRSGCASWSSTTSS